MSLIDNGRGRNASHNLLVAHAKMMAKARIPVESNHRHTIAQIVATIARIHHSTPAELMGDFRHVYIVRARYHLIHMLRQLRPGRSDSQLGRDIARDRRTVRYARSVFDRRVRPYIGPQMQEAERLLGDEEHE